MERRPLQDMSLEEQDDFWEDNSEETITFEKSAGVEMLEMPELDRDPI